MGHAQFISPSFCTDLYVCLAAVLKQKCARMHQILFQFPFFPDPTTGGSAPGLPGRRGTAEKGGVEGKGQGRERGEEGKGRGGKGEGGGRKGRGSLRHCRCGDRRPWD